MKKNVGLTYVSEFSFPPEQGFTGSAGRSEVKGYMRGGKVKGRNKAPTGKKLAKGTTKAAMGGFMGPEREIAVDDVTITVPKKFGEGGYYGKPGDKYPKSKANKKMPRNVKKRGGKVSMHDKLKSAGAKMGYAYGGRVKYGKSGDTSSEFVMKTKKQDTMDHGVQPARRGKNARNQAEAEAGGTGRLKPGLAKGGLARAASKGVRKLKGVMSDAERRHMKRLDKAAKKGMSKKGMPKNVKSKGGRVEYSQGGVVKKA